MPSSAGFDTAGSDAAGGEGRVGGFFSQKRLGKTLWQKRLQVRLIPVRRASGAPHITLSCTEPYLLC